jgi:hypothetical protein
LGRLVLLLHLIIVVVVAGGIIIIITHLLMEEVEEERQGEHRQLCPSQWLVRVYPTQMLVQGLIPLMKVELEVLMEEEYRTNVHLVDGTTTATIDQPQEVIMIVAHVQY